MIDGSRYRVRIPTYAATAIVSVLFLPNLSDILPPIREEKINTIPKAPIARPDSKGVPPIIPEYQEAKISVVPTVNTTRNVMTYPTMRFCFFIS